MKKSDDWHLRLWENTLLLKRRRNDPADEPKKNMNSEFTITTTEGTSLYETRQKFFGTLIEAKAKSMEMLCGKASVSVLFQGTCYFLAFASGKIAINN